jgi:hypothetical protein
MKAFDAHDEVERFVGERQKFRGDDVGHPVRISRDVERRYSRRRRQQIVVRPRPAEDVQHVLGSLTEAAKRGREVIDEAAHVEVVELRRLRAPSRAPHLRDGGGREGFVSPPGTGSAFLLPR